MIRVQTPIVGPVNLINATGVPNLSAAQIEFLATRGNWLINADWRVAPLGPQVGNGDDVVFPGQGVPDLDYVQSLMDKYQWARFSVDVGGPDSFAEYVYLGTNDMIFWREAFIRHWGTVSRPQYWSNDRQQIPINVPPGTNWP